MGGLSDYPVYVCRCAEGPYLGAQKWGTPIHCERCGFLTQEQLDALRTPAPDAVPSGEATDGTTPTKEAP